MQDKTNSYEGANTRIKNNYPYFINDVDFEDFKKKTPFEIWFIFKFDYFIENVESVNQVERSKDFKYSEQLTKYLPSEILGKYAYYERMPFDILNNKIDNNEYYFKDFSIVDFRTNTNYIKLFDSYRRGFKNGYDSFKEEIDRDIKNGDYDINDIFGYLKKQSYKYPKVQTDRPPYKDKWVEILTEEDFETWGRLAGERYMVWYFILEDVNSYLPLFLADESMIKMYQNGLSVLSDIPQMSNIVERLKALLNEIEPSTEQAEDKDREVDKDIKDEVTGRDCVEFDNLFGNDIKGKNEIWHYMKLLKMIDDNGNYLKGSNTRFIRAFIVVMVNHFKVPDISITNLIGTFTLKIFGKTKRINDHLVIDEKRIEDFLNGN